MTILDSKIKTHMEKAEVALREARALYDLGFNDGARSRATVSSIQAFTAVCLADTRPGDPSDIIERAKVFAATGRLPDGADIYFRAAILARRDADETDMKTPQEGALKSISTSQTFLQAVQDQLLSLQTEPEIDQDSLKRGR
jgi:uncharacterized protein (UPF0332 family)